jgi:putative heme iron utilization protein
MMSPETARLLLTFLRKERILSLAVVAEGEPIVGLLPFVWTADGGALLVQASGLARHARGLAPGAPFDALVHAPDHPDGDALQVPRLTLRGHVHRLERGSAAFGAAAEAYRQRFPSAGQTLELSDFHLYRLEVEGGRLVAGFARAVGVSPEELRLLAGAAPP